MLNADPVLALLSRALDAAALRQTVHATNVANVDTEGYRRLEVIYSAELQRLNAEGPALDAQRGAAVGAGRAGSGGVGRDHACGSTRKWRRWRRTPCATRRC